MSQETAPNAAATRRTPRGLPSVMAGRTLATGFTALLFLIGLTSGLHEDSAEVIALFVMFGLAAVCSLLAWWKAGPGAPAVALAGLALAVFFAAAGGDDRLLLALLFGGPYLLAALLLWFGASRLAGA